MTTYVGDSVLRDKGSSPGAWTITVVRRPPLTETDEAIRWLTSLPLHEVRGVLGRGESQGVVGINPYWYRRGALEIDLGPALVVGEAREWTALIERLLSHARRTRFPKGIGRGDWGGVVERVEPSQVIDGPDFPLGIAQWHSQAIAAERKRGLTDDEA